MNYSPTPSFSRTDPINSSIKSNDYLMIDYQDEETQTRSNFYRMPIPPNIDQYRTFNPQEWSLKNFKIGRHLGRGKFGHVYLAKERRTDQIVALKVLSKKQIVESNVISQIRRQIEIHTHLHHDSILKMFGFFFDDKRIYMILEYASGGQLYRLFRSHKKFPQRRAANMVKQMIEAVSYCHSQQVIHRDIKPENILIDENDRLKLSDFGWAVHARRNRLTFCGTMEYICPEILLKHDYDHRVDVWAIGVLAYELCCGHSPFDASTKAETARNIMKINYSFPQHFSIELQNFIRHLLVRQPKSRGTLQWALKSSWIQINCLSR